MKRLAILASGGGTNAEAIINFFKQNPEMGSVELIISNNSDAYVLQRAENHGIKALVISKKMMRENPTLLVDSLTSEKIDFIILGGYMLLIPANVVEMFPRKVVNIHPALLPKFGGKGMYGDNVHRAVIEKNETESGITIHFVNEHYDEGNVVFQTKCDVTKDDTHETLAAKIHLLEHKYYPQIINQILSNL